VSNCVLRAEYSHTSRHIAEFWMIEPEVAFANLDDCMYLAEAYLKYVLKYALDNNMEDLEFLQKQYQDVTMRFSISQ
jgi:asparaginyl-tRNA synthetase